MPLIISVPASGLGPLQILVKSAEFKCAISLCADDKVGPAAPRAPHGGLPPGAGVGGGDG